MLTKFEHRGVALARTSPCDMRSQALPRCRFRHTESHRYHSTAHSGLMDSSRTNIKQQLHRTKIHTLFAQANHAPARNSSPATGHMPLFAPFCFAEKSSFPSAAVTIEQPMLPSGVGPCTILSLSACDQSVSQPVPAHRREVHAGRMRVDRHLTVYVTVLQRSDVHHQSLDVRVKLPQQAQRGFEHSAQWTVLTVLSSSGISWLKTAQRLKGAGPRCPCLLPQHKRFACMSIGATTRACTTSCEGNCSSAPRSQKQKNTKLFYIY